MRGLKLYFSLFEIENVMLNCVTVISKNLSWFPGIPYNYNQFNLIVWLEWFYLCFFFQIKKGFGNCSIVSVISKSLSEYPSISSCIWRRRVHEDYIYTNVAQLPMVLRMCTLDDIGRDSPVLPNSWGIATRHYFAG